METEAQVLEVIREMLASAYHTGLSLKEITSRLIERHGEKYERKVTRGWIGTILRRWSGVLLGLPLSAPRAAPGKIAADLGVGVGTVLRPSQAARRGVRKYSLQGLPQAPPFQGPIPKIRRFRKELFLARCFVAVRS